MPIDDSTDAAVRNCKQKSSRLKDVLKDYVKSHVYIMLKLLYEDIGALESSPMNSASRGFHDAQSWFQNLYSNEEGNITVVGPVGERPLHVCFLSAYRFEGVDFAGAGNYMREGIIAGIQEFVASKGADWSELYAQYGKDYCAAVGNFLKRRSSVGNDTKVPWSSDPQTFWLHSVEADHEPPFWTELKQWFRKHRYDQSHCTMIGLTRPQSYEVGGTFHNSNSVTVGIYEGESVLFPVIAAGDGATLYWLTNPQRSLLKPPRS